MNARPQLRIAETDADFVFKSVPREYFEQAFELSIGGAGWRSSHENAFSLRREEHVWCLQALDHPEWRPLVLDYTRGRSAERLRKAWSSRELLKEALSFRRGEELHVVDATAGLMSDALLMGAWGLKVVAFERNPALCFLGMQALETLRMEAQNFDVVLICDRFGSAASLEEARRRLEGRIDRVYLDPLYPPRPKDALNSKELRFVAEVSRGQEQDTLSQMIEAALQLEPSRLLVKRPQWEQPLRHSNLLSTCCRGRSTRFDVLHTAEKRRVN
jgi:16S rRNA (guanine1516-N2)-methyltransferase